MNFYTNNFVSRPQLCNHMMFSSVDLCISICIKCARWFTVANFAWDFFSLRCRTTLLRTVHVFPPVIKTLTSLPLTSTSLYSLQSEASLYVSTGDLEGNALTFSIYVWPGIIWAFALSLKICWVFVPAKTAVNSLFIAALCITCLGCTRHVSLNKLRTLKALGIFNCLD